MFKLFSKGDQLKIKLTNFKFSKIGDGPKFLLFGGVLAIGEGIINLLSICYYNSPGWVVQALHSSVSACMNRLMQDGDIERMQPLVPIPKCVLRLSRWVILLGSVWQEPCSRKLKQLLHLYVVHLRSNIFLLHNLRWFCCIWYRAVLCGMIRMLPVIIDV